MRDYRESSARTSGIVRGIERAGRYRRAMWRLVLVSVAALALLAVPRSGGGATTGEQLAFVRSGSIWTIGADGASARLLIRDAHSPAWSPDGSRIAFVSARSGDEEIYVARANGRDVRRLTRHAGADLGPAWSRSGRRIAWSRDREIWTMSAFGSDKRAVVLRGEHWHEHYSPSWLGAALVYSSNRISSFNTELFRTPARRLTFTHGSDGVLGDDSMPDVSPDGRRIVFTSNRDQQGEIYVMNANGTGQRRLTRRPGDDWSPDFSSDGTRIAFTQLPGTVWVMSTDGTGLRALTRGTDADWRPL
jgi:Tol biopolymer transport system component